MGLRTFAPVRCDLLNAPDVQELARTIGGRADAVLYLAANGDPAASSERPRWDLESNTAASSIFSSTARPTTSSSSRPARCTTA